MFNKIIPPSIHFPDSGMDRDFVEKTLWSFGCGIQRRIGAQELCEVALSSSLEEVGEKMWRIIEARMLSGNLHFILGPITPSENRTVEQNLIHFLTAYYFHASKSGRVVFPQFLFTPIIRQITGEKIKNGYDQDLAHQEILQMYDFLFRKIKENSEPEKINGWLLEGYESSKGASWERDVFRENGWGLHLPEETNLNEESYISSKLVNVA